MAERFLKCPECSNLNQPGLAACARCGTALAGAPEVVAVQTARAAQREPSTRVIVTDFDMPFGSMVAFMIKWTLAAIPAILILGVLALMGAAFLVNLGRSL